VSEERPHSQAEVEDVILDVLSCGIPRTTQEITSAVRNRLPLTSADRAGAAKRQNERKVDQIIANALQAGRRLCRDLLIERISIGTFKITPAGQNALLSRAADIEEMSKIADGLGIDFTDV
jgi:hypothetical protein